MLVYLATCAQLPEPDPDHDLLIAALADQGVDAQPLAWDDPASSAAALRRADLCVIRSTWNYYHRRDDFLRWVDALATVTAVRNPPEVVRWSTDKRYLADLWQRGVAVVPTVFLEQGQDTRLRALMDERGWREVVVKPRVSAASFATQRFSAETAGAGQEFLTAHLGDRAMMVQPYLRAVEDYGERALVWIDGAFTHAVRKTPRLYDQDEAVSDALPIAPDELALGTRALASLATGRHPLLYARVDVTRDADGQLVVMELELAEPSLFLAQNADALTRFARAIARCAAETTAG